MRLLVNTLKHLKAKQIVYQVVYKVIKAKPLSGYLSPGMLTPSYLMFSNFLPVIPCASTHQRFNFLNQEVQFQTKIDWQYAANGKLWNYNLQYGNYLLQSDIPLEKRIEWITDLYSCLNNGGLPLEPYPVSLRAINVIRLCSNEKIEDQRILKPLSAELQFLSKRFEFHLLGNHLLENAFALLMGGAFFNNKAWQDKARKVLEQELNEQILADGGHFELSPMYHQVILYRLLELIDWYTGYPEKVSVFLNFLNARAAMMLAWLKNMTFHNNEIPLFNDSAPGIAYDTDRLLRYAAHLGVKPAPTLPLSASGYRMYHNNTYECAVDVAPIAASYQPGHGHADALSFILYYKDAPVFIEAGTSTYNDGETREFERSTAAHSTVIVNQANSSQVWGNFRVADRANSKILKEDKQAITASHDGYYKDFKVTHQRSFTFTEREVAIQDNLIGKTVNNAAARFYLHPNVKYSFQNDGNVLLENIGTITFSDARDIKIKECAIAHGYNRVLTSNVIEVFFDRELHTRIVFL
ncbi:MAG: alginate lyase family protein [Bacteroidetes bacterium]|nr:alginate lyase family protein [Bacteroidota bacterium]